MSEKEKIQKEIQPFIEKMVLDIMKEKPKDIAKYMIYWLQKYGGYTSTGLTLEEKKELEDLRFQVKKYRELESHSSNKEDEDKSFSEESEDDIDPELDNVLEKMPEQKKKIKFNSSFCSKCRSLWRI